MKTRLLLLSALFLASTQLFAATSYVTMTGAGTQDGTSWANARPANALQLAINGSITGDQVWVAEGIYRPLTDHLGSSNPTDPRLRCFYMKAGVKIYGGFPNTGSPTLAQRRPFQYLTKLSGDWNANGNIADNSYSVIYNLNNNLTNSAILDGFTITEGNSGVNTGAGIENVGASPTISNCYITANIGAKGSAIANETNSNARIVKCVIFENTSTNVGGALYNLNSTVTVSNCLIINNSAANFGAVLYQEGGTVTFSFCTIANNIANSRGTIVCFTGTNPNTTSIYNSIIAENSADEYTSTSAGTPYSYNRNNSNLTQYYNQTLPTNYYGSPAFLDSSDPNGVDDIFGTSDDGFNILISSPAIDKGSVGNIPAGITTDMKGDARIFNSFPDLGAYESQVVATENQEKLETLVATYPNPTTNNIVLDLAAINIAQSAKVSIYDVTGRLLVTETLLPNAAKQPYSISIEKQPAGSYLVQIIIDNNQTISRKITKIQ